MHSLFLGLHFISARLRLLLQGCCAVAQKQADCVVKGRGSDPGGHGLLWLVEHGCDRGPRSGCCRLQSEVRNGVKAGGQASHVDGWCRRESP